jgi:sirohydrochlorin ferrochelatase
MEGSHPPLLADILRDENYADRDVLIAPLFLSPGRHAGPGGDIARICRLAPADCHLADLIGTHPLALDALTTALQHSLSLHPAHSLA